MTTIDMRKNILTAINRADNRLLRLIHALIESYHEEEIVTYTIEGKPLTQAGYQQEITDAETEIENGNYTTHEDLKKKMLS